MAEETEDKALGTGSSGDDLTDNPTDVPFVGQDASKIVFKSSEKEQDIDEPEEEEEEEEEEESGKSASDKEAEEEEEEEEGAGKGPDASKDPEGKIEYKSYADFQSSVEKMLTKVTKGSVKSFNDVSNVITENQRLKQENQALQKKEPEFVNAKHKELFEYASKAAVLDKATIGQFIQVTQLGDIDKLSDKDAQFEAFVLTRPDLTRDKAKKIHDLEYDRKYTDLENDILQQDAHGQATRDAKAKLNEIQTKFNGAEAATENNKNGVDMAKLEPIYKSIDEATPDFGGLSIQLGDTDDEVLALQLGAEEESEFNEFVKNPVTFMENIIEQCHSNGNFDAKAWLGEMFTLYKAFKGDLAKESLALGKKLGKLEYINDKKNPKDKTGKGEAPRAPKKSFEDTMVEAYQSSLQN